MRAGAQRVLVVDDEPTTRETIADVLRELGFEVAVAEDGRDALGKVEKAAPDLVITDLTMPRLHGVGLIEELRRSHPDVCVIVITARSTADAEGEAQLLGAEDYLNKPIDLDDMVHRVQRVLNGSAGP